jgi:hypothetical protein
MPVLDPVDIGSVELPGVDVAGQAPQTNEIDALDILQPDPPLIETVEELTVHQMEHDEPTQVAEMMETTGPRAYQYSQGKKRFSQMIQMIY